MMNLDALPAPRQMTLADGRTLNWREYGDPQGFALFTLHGTPGSSAFFSANDATFSGLGLRAIAPDRAGYGHSDPVRGLTFSAYSRDLQALASHLSIERFAVLGFSGGGGFATACAAELGEQVTGAVLMSAMAPSTLEQARDMGPQVYKAFEMAAKAPAVLRLMMGINSVIMRRFPRLMPRLNKAIPDADRVILERYLDLLHLDARLGFRQGTAAACNELMQYTRPHSFDYADIRVPVHLVHGERDANGPLAIAERVAGQIPGARLTILPGQGHLFGLADIAPALQDLPRA